MAPKNKENLEIKDLEFDTEGLHIQDGKDVIHLVAIPTGSLSLDVLLGGGYNAGVMQAWGPDRVGKTTLYLIMAGNFQKFYNYEKCRVYIHCTEGRYNPRLLKMAPLLQMESPTETVEVELMEKAENKGKKRGTIPRPIFRITYPKSGEKMYDFILKTLKQDKIKFFHIIDSSDGIRSEVNEGKMMSDPEKTANIASLNTRFCKDASVYANHYGHIIAYTHQIRDKISTGYSQVSGVGKQRAGGHAVNHYSNLRMNFENLWSDLYIYENPSDVKSRKIGHMMAITLDKVSGSGNVFSKLRIPFIYDQGIDKIREILSLSEAYQLVERKGASYTLNGENIGIGENKALDYLRKHPDAAISLEEKIRQFAGI